MHPETVRQTQWFLCLVQVRRIYMAPVEETPLGFVLATKRVPRCKEEAVL